MPRTEHLPIYKAAYDLCLWLEQVVRGFSRSFGGVVWDQHPSRGTHAYALHEQWRSPSQGARTDQGRLLPSGKRIAYMCSNGQGTRPELVAHEPLWPACGTG